MSEPEKRRKTNATYNKTQNSHANLYFVPARMQLKRLSILKNCATSNGYLVSENYSGDVDYIVTEFETKEQVGRFMKVGVESIKSKIVSVDWFTESIKNKTPIPVENNHVVASEALVAVANPATKLDVDIYNCYACQRKTTLKHHNHKLADALELVAKHAELRDSPIQNDYPRALAFRKAAAAIKSLPFAVRRVEEVVKLKDVGKHSLQIIQEILEDGSSFEVEQIKNDEWFNVVKNFSTIFGVGSSIANQWYTLGFRKVEELKEKKNFPAQTERINYGLAFLADLNTPVTVHEANRILEYVQKLAEKILPGVILQLVGGFRRGKPAGHDVDILFTHPNMSGDSFLLKELHRILSDRALVLYGYMQKSSFTEAVLKDESPMQGSTMDNFEKCFYIFKLPHEEKDWDNMETFGDLDLQRLTELANSSRTWRAIRVDLIWSPIEQFPFALVGWTGNRDFNRSVRNYSKKRLNMKLTSHGLWAYENQRSVPAKSEQEVFSLLNLKYLEPWERNV